MHDGSPYNDIYTQQNAQNSQLESRVSRDIVHQAATVSSRPNPNNEPITIIVNPVESDSSTIRSDEDDPPSYYEAMASPVFYDQPPPSYDSIYGRVIEAQRQSKTVLDFAKKLVIIFCGTLSFTFVLAFTIIIPACMIAFGLIYMRECPQGHFIPVYLLVGGIMGILKQLLSLSVYVRHNPEDRNLERSRNSGTHRMIHLFMVCWFLVGSYFVYRIYEPNYDPHKGGGGYYCNRTLYLFAFWLITFVYIGIAILTVALILISILSCVLREQLIRNSTTV